jgi:hypothetical protein
VVLQLQYTESKMPSGFFRKKKPHCTPLDRARVLENRSRRPRRSLGDGAEVGIEGSVGAGAAPLLLVTAETFTPDFACGHRNFLHDRAGLARDTSRKFLSTKRASCCKKQQADPCLVFALAWLVS